MTLEAVPLSESAARIRVQVRGQVQGVGFRPFVYRLAKELGLSGWVRNCGFGVEMEVQGASEQLDSMLRRLHLEPPALARISGVTFDPAELQSGCGFAIVESAGGVAATRIAPDAALCPECLEELFSRGDRRYLYPFINCTHCGPRYTIAARLPYDREHTSMAKFPLCSDCLDEYRAPDDRRFHAEAVCCAVCGPRLALFDADGAAVDADSVIASAAAMLSDGKILAVKGLGGFHLMTDANNPAAVARLRGRKAREEKPFAVMALNAASLGAYATFTDVELSMLESPERPIVLVGRKALLSCVADEMASLGAMLPYTPLHYLLFHHLAGCPDGTRWLADVHPHLLVCTSANPGGEPLAYRNEDALLRLKGIADGFLMHDRDILVRADDSVVSIAGDKPRFIRRSRGYTPMPIELAVSGPSVLAAGGYFKNTLCLTRNSEAFLSQHIGELDNAASCEALEAAFEHLSGVLKIRPELVVHDLHPDFFSSRFAALYADRHGIRRLAVQHHHAHIGAVAAEHGIQGPLLGLALDGVGLGLDGGAWGGELLRVDGADMRRLGHLAPLAMPGGDVAAAEPWRMAASALAALGRGDEISQRIDEPAANTVASMLKHGAAQTSSCGRLFDAVAALLGVKYRNGFEGQAAMLLEAFAARHGSVSPMSGGYTLDGSTLGFLPVLDALADTSLDAGFGAALFHATLAAGLAAWAQQAAENQGIDRVALGGGCFLNRTLSGSLVRLLEDAGLKVFEARWVPPNDGGLALGQAWVGLNFLKD